MTAGRFAGETVVVAGGTSGVGEAAVRRFAEEGARIAFFGLDAARGERIAAEIDAAMFETIDWTIADDVTSFCERMVARIGAPDVLYNHAGTVIVKPFLETRDEDWNRLWDINLMGMVRATRAFLPHMIAGGGGAIVNMASISGFTVSELESTYCVTKGACMQLTRAVAVEFRDKGIRCNAICPGFIRTPHGLRELKELNAQGAIVTEADLGIMQGRIAEPVDIAEAVLHLADRRSAFINGAMLVVDNAATVRTS